MGSDRLKDRKSGHRGAGERMGFITAKTIKPEAIPLDIKVALIGTPMLYRSSIGWIPTSRALQS